MIRNYTEELKKILASSMPDEEKKNSILQYHENDSAGMLDELEPDEREELYRVLGNESIAEVILYSDDIGEIVESLEPEHAADIIETLDADDAMDILEELDEESRQEIVALLDEDARDDIEALANYDEDVVGSRMTNNYITVGTWDSVKSAMRKVIDQAAENDNVSNIFVLEANDTLYGVIELRDLIIAREGTDLKSLIKTNYPSFLDTLDISECINELKEYALDSYPIVDSEHKLVGVITSDDVVEAVDDEMSEDYARFAGLTEEEDIDESIFQSVKKRIPWLIVLLVLGLCQSFLMTGFERVVATLPVIVFFQTLVLGMSGNTGTQSLAVTIRMLSTEDNPRKKIIKTILKEIRIGFTNGLLLSMLAFAFVFLFLRITNQGVTDGVDYFILEEAIKGSCIVASALLIAMTVSSFVGAFVPILFSKIKIDPAVASGPFITTINDVTAMLIYYSLAAVLFNVIM